jgi:ornithine cyclodeaminase/alanine dehydrogenase
MLVLGRADLEALLEPRELIDALARAFTDAAAGRAHVPPRTTVPVTGDGVLLLMPAAAPTVGGVALGTKLVTFYAGNHARREPTIQSTYVLMDGTTGRPLALIEGGYLTGIRTGAASALAARYLASKDARRLVCFGAGVQAGFQIQCLAAEFRLERVDVIGRDPARARHFAEWWTAKLRLPVNVVTDADAAVAAADIITCATTATEPLFSGRRIASGAHVDAVGAFQLTAREVDWETVRRSRVIVDQPGAIDSAGDLAIPIKEGLVERTHVAGDLADLVSGKIPGRTRPQEITLFKSVGFALEDLAAARLAFERAMARGRGHEIDLT